MSLCCGNVVKSAAMFLVWFTVSKAFDGLVTIASLRRGEGRGLLKPVGTLCTSGNKTEMVDLFFFINCVGCLIRTILG